MFGMSNVVTILWLLVFPGCTILVTIFFRTNTWKRIINYYSGWLDEESDRKENYAKESKRD